MQKIFKSRVIGDFDTWRLAQRNKVCVYVIYIGIIRGEYLFKYGETIDLARRVGTHHAYFYKDARQNNSLSDFDVVYYRETSKRLKIQNEFGYAMNRIRLRRKPQINGNNHVEMFTISKKYNLDNILHILDTIASEYPGPTNITKTGKRLLIPSRQCEERIYIDIEGSYPNYNNDIDSTSESDIDSINDYVVDLPLLSKIKLSSIIKIKMINVHFEYINQTVQLEKYKAHIMDTDFNITNTYKKLLLQDLNIDIKDSEIDILFLHNYQNLLKLLIHANKNKINISNDFNNYCTLSLWIYRNNELYNEQKLEDYKIELFESITNYISTY
jgi:hypothetical protein